jgi:S-methylmethionine-dependent homocysteine/selenocysteine methylase
MEDDFDFGFTAVDEQELPQAQVVAQATQNNAELQEQLQQVYNSIIPLLKNLKANPEKDYILWPNRTKKIDAFKKKLDSVVGDNVTKKDI